MQLCQHMRMQEQSQIVTQIVPEQHATITCHSSVTAVRLSSDNAECSPKPRQCAAEGLSAGLRSLAKTYQNWERLPEPDKTVCFTSTASSIARLADKQYPT